MLLFILGILDIIIGALLWVATGNPFAGSTVVIVLGIIWFFKGIWSVISGASAGFFFDFLGIFDFLAGVFLMLSFMGMSFGFVMYLAILMVIKGLYSLLMGFR
jgi:hypothetical protein